MNQNSPGSSAEDIEMVDIDGIPLLTKVRPQNGVVPFADQDAYDEYGDSDDGSRGLLSGSLETTRFERPGEKVWPQVKGIVVESAPALLMTTVSLLFTGELLDKVSHWRAMREVDQLIMIIPVVLNLNGNLEMNLSARLGTAANVGELDDPKRRRSIILGNLAFLQVQTVSVSFIAACVALILGHFVPGAIPTKNATAEVGRKSGFPTFVMVASTTMTAASFSGIILGSLMCTIVVLCRKFDRDPDNIAPAVASCLGDLFTLVLLGTVSTILIPYKLTVIPFVVACLVLCASATCLMYTLRNEHSRPMLTEGWSPLFGAMAISSGTGIVLDMFVSRYEGFAVLAIVISGLPGAAGSILVSRLSTGLHTAKLALERGLPSYNTQHKHPEPSALLTMATLVLITLPVELVFLSILDAFGWLELPYMFIVISVAFFFCAVLSSLLIARFLTKLLWSFNRDPDSYALPIHSALMDLIGQLLLVLCFEIVSRLGIKVRKKN